MTSGDIINGSWFQYSPQMGFGAATNILAIQTYNVFLLSSYGQIDFKENVI
jgi:hypothetical protein